MKTSLPLRALLQQAIDGKTKPPGSLGMLEGLALWLGELQETSQPSADPAEVLIFAADHGAASAGLSAYPQSVTRQMVLNFAAGGAAISVLARHLDARLEVVDVGVLGPAFADPRIIDAKVRAGSRSFLGGPALSADEVQAALAVGRAAVGRAMDRGARCLILGEMGIGNSASAAALAAALHDEAAAAWVGPGTGLHGAALERKRVLIDQALARRPTAATPEGLLAEYGGLEIVALVGALLAAAEARLAVLVDGYIVSVGLAYALRIDSGVSAVVQCAHLSAEPGHGRLLARLNLRPLLDLRLRLGEASGAILALPLLRAACAILNEMASFESATVDRAL